MKFRLHKDHGFATIRKIGNRLRTRGSGHHWIEKYRGDIFVNISDGCDEHILRNEFSDLLDVVCETKQR